MYKFPPDIKNDELRDEVQKISEHKTCGGVIVQLPLPEHVNAQYILNVIPREKDVDILGERALGAFYADRNPVVPPAVGVVEKILSTFNLQLSTATVAIVGLGPLVGKPISTWLMRKVKGLHLLHRGSDFSLLKNADLVITGVGKAGLIKPEMLKSGAGVIDFGYDTAPAPSQTNADLTQTDAEKGKLVGDLDVSSSLLSSLSFYTPTPGGTGPILVAKVFENFYKLNNGGQQNPDKISHD